MEFTETLLSSIEEDSNEGDVLVLQGKNWKLGIDRRSSSDGDVAFVGGKDWSVSLSQAEYKDFIQLLQSLRYINRNMMEMSLLFRQGVATLEVCGDWGAEGSEAQLEMSTPRVWMQGRASQKRLALLNRLWSRQRMDPSELPTVAFSLRFGIRSTGRREAEGSWSADAVMQVLKALQDVPSNEERLDPGSALTNPVI